MRKVVLEFANDPRNNRLRGEARASSPSPATDAHRHCTMPRSAPACPGPSRSPAARPLTPRTPRLMVALPPPPRSAAPLWVWAQGATTRPERDRRERAACSRSRRRKQTVHVRALCSGAEKKRRSRCAPRICGKGVSGSAGGKRRAACVGVGADGREVDGAGCVRTWV